MRPWPASAARAVRASESLPGSVIAKLREVRKEGQLDLTGLHIEHGVRRVALGEDYFAAGVIMGSSTFAGPG